MMKSDPKTHQAQLQVLIGAGKEMASSLLQDAQATAESPEQLSAQVFAVQVAGCHILAICAFNQERQNGLDGDQWLDQTLMEIKKDLEGLRLAHERGELATTPVNEKAQGPKVIT